MADEENEVSKTMDDQTSNMRNFVLIKVENLAFYQ